MFAPIHPIANFQSLGDWFIPDTMQRWGLNMKIDCMDPFWGYGEFIYGKAASANIVKGSVCVQQAANLGTYDLVPNVANQGFPLVVALQTMALATFGWFQKAGLAVYAMNATVAAGAAVGITAAGVLGANTAGKQMLGVTHVKSQLATVVLTNVQTVNGLPRLLSNGYDGLFVGVALTGVGIPANTVVGKLDPDGRTIYMGSAIGLTDRNATATGAATVTGTLTGFGVGHVESPFAQGAIT